MVEEPYCSEAEGNCGYPEFSPIYFTSFFLASNYVLLNMIIAIILDNFGDTVALSEAEVTEESIDQFKEAWQHFDTNADGFIAADCLVKILMQLDYPLGSRNTPGVQHRKSALKLARDV